MTATIVEAGQGVGREPQLASFRARCETLAGEPMTSPRMLHDFSVTRFRDFWATFLDWSGIVHEGVAEPVCTSDDVAAASFFPGIRLNYAENLLMGRGDDDAPALTSVHGDGSVDRFSRGRLRDAVCRTSAALSVLGIGSGDMVVAVGPNNARVAISALAVAGLGATLSTAAPDMGLRTLLGRFEQVEPVALLVDRTGLAGDPQQAQDLLAALSANLPTLAHVLVLDDAALPALPGVSTARLSELVAAVPGNQPTPTWPRLPLDHPLWVMFTSGTTGPPKAMVHGAGGVLLEHLKEHRLHGDLRAGDTLYFHTTTAWMMWHWQLSALGVGAHVVLYDGPVDGPETLWRLVAAHHVTVFGTSPAYLQLCQDEGYRPREDLDLSALRALLCTGAVLHDWQFDWVAEAAAGVPVQSISGGTDIMGCFVLGHPELPVQRGRSQSLGLGLDVAALDEDGQPVLGQVGELVCRRPFPSRPVRFLRDPSGERFRDAYFSAHPGVWTHGDLIEISADGSARMHGRSDGVLNVDGVRIGPAEVYRILRGIPGVVDAMAVEQPDPSRTGSSRLVLLVVLRPGLLLDERLTRRIRSTLRREGSPAHVPALVVAVDELPVTHNGKRSERAARDALAGRPVANATSLRNPGCLTAIAAAAARAGEPRAVPEPSDDAVARAFSEVLGTPVPDTLSFFDAGGTSRQSMTLLRRLRVQLGRALPMEAFLSDPTIRGVRAAAAAGSSSPGADLSRLELLRPGVSQEPPLYLVHGSYGDADGYRYLVQQLPPGPAVYAVVATLTDVDGGSLPVTALASGEPDVISALAALHVDTVEAHRPTGPLQLAGYSFGGLLALEMARRFRERGREVTFLGLLDVRPPYGSLNRVERSMRQLAGLLAILTGRSDNTLRAVLGEWLLRREVTADDQLLRQSRTVYEAFRLPVYPGPVCYFRVARRIPVLAHLLFVWRRFTPDMLVADVPGIHFDMLAERFAPRLAATVWAAMHPTGRGLNSLRP